MAISVPIQKRLFALSGNVCPFPGCDELLSEESDGGGPPVILGDIAHIVAQSRQGPRGPSSLTDQERDTAANLIILCRRHHRIVDADPRTYTVAVLHKVKADHELHHLSPQAAAPQSLIVEKVSATYLPIRQLPATVFTATTSARGINDVVSRLRRTAKDTAPVLPFLLRDGRLHAFDDLTASSSPLARVIDQAGVQQQPAHELWADGEGFRRYIALLNKGLTLLLRRDHGLTWDRDHRRYYFPRTDQTVAGLQVQTKTGRSQTRQVVLERVNRKTVKTRDWVHEAVQLRFERFADDAWGLSVLPAFHLTSDGHTPLPSRLIGPRVTRKKGSIFNDRYYDRINFWREHLTGGTPRFIMRFGHQAVVADREFPTATVQWPDIADKRFDPAGGPAEDLLTQLDLDQATNHDFEWDDDDFDDDDWPQGEVA